MSSICTYNIRHFDLLRYLCTIGTPFYDSGQDMIIILLKRTQLSVKLDLTPIFLQMTMKDRLLTMLSKQNGIDLEEYQQK